MISLFTTFAKHARIALLAAGMFAGAGAATAQSMQTPEKYNPPQGDPSRYTGGDTRRTATPVLKFEATSVPIYDSNAMLNLEYNQIRSTPVAPVEKQVGTAVRTTKVPTISELEVQLKQAREQYKGAKLAYTQAVRSKDKTRVAQAKTTRDGYAADIKRLKRQIAARKAADKAAQRASAGEKTNATVKQTSGGANRTTGSTASNK